MEEDDDPFPVGNLVIKDILRDAFEPDVAPRRRIGPHMTGTQLLGLARGRPHSWAKKMSMTAP